MRLTRPSVDTELLAASVVDGAVVDGSAVVGIGGITSIACAMK